MKYPEMESIMEIKDISANPASHTDTKLKDFRVREPIYV